MFDEMSMRQRWTHVAKDPSKAIKDSSNTKSAWAMLNHLPKEQIKNVVTDKILRYDKESC